MRASLLRAPFGRLWLANLMSASGAQVSRMAVILFLFHQGDDIRRIAFFVLAATVPGVLAAPLAGALIDRSNKRSVMLLAELSRMGAATAILLRPEPAVIYAATAFFSIGTAFFEPARAACIPALVGPSLRPTANGLDQMSSGIVLVAGPILGAEVFLAGGLAAALIVDLALRAGCVLLVFTLDAPSLRGDVKRRDTLAAIRDGWRYIGAHDSSLYAVLLVAVSVFCVTLWVPVAPLYLRQLFTDSDRILGLQTGLFGVGGVIGGFAAPHVLRFGGRGTTFFCGLAAEGVLLTLYSQVRNVSLSIAVCLVWGVCVSFTLVAYYVLIQELVGPEFLGRVMAFAQQGEGLATIASMGLAIALFRIMSPRHILELGGIAYVATVSLFAATRAGTRLLRTR